MYNVTFGVNPGEHIPGSVLSKYLSAYAEQFNLHRHMQLNTNVESAKELPENRS